MEKGQIIFALVFISGLLITIAIFFWLILLTQRMRANKLFHEQLAMKRDYELKELESRLVVQESTFGQISREIHDNVGQVLTLTKIQLSLFEYNDSMDKEMLYAIRENISSALTDLRDIAKGLDGDLIRETGFEDMIVREAGRIERLRLFKVELKITGNPIPINGQFKLALFRIVQEIFQNIIKHAGATKVVVVIHYSVNELQICIEDNGKGFDKQVSKSGSGISNMHRRSSQIGATFDILSVTNKGTSVKIKIGHE